MTTTETTAASNTAPLAISVNNDESTTAQVMNSAATAAAAATTATSAAIAPLKTGSTNKKHYVQHFPPQQATPTATNHRANIVDERDKASFYKDLYHFHEVKGTPIPRPPRVNGHEIDLHKFYSLVCSRGGWAKINYRNEWEDLVPEFDLPSKCVNASVALKQIYMRFLDRYEKVHFLGEDNDRIADHYENDEDNRHKKWNNKHFNDVPMKYNYGQHNVADSQRATHKLSTDLYKSSEYERLLMSLMSPLPNEQDFAVNVCTLMANETRHTLKVERCPKLLDALMGHAGVYSHHSMRELFHEYYSNVRKHSLQSFWNDCLHDKPDILELTYEDYFEVDENVASSGVCSGGAGGNRPPVRLRQNIHESFEDGLNTRANELNDISTLDFLNLKRGLGTHDYIGQRVHQVSTICRNLSFFDENLATIVKNRTFVRFLVMCANIRWGNLHQMGLDTLGNIAIELDLCDPNNDSLTKCLLATISEGLESPDRGVIIGCLEILYKLCQKGTNEEHLHKYLDKRVYRQICMYLSLNDIMLLLYTLECLFALSSMGEKACFAIVQINGVIDTLVSLVSVEAQSYGPDGCILMRVVETVPTPIASQQQPHQHQQQQHQSYHSHHQTFHQLQQTSHATAAVVAQPMITQLQNSSSANPVSDRSTVETKVEVKNEFRSETKPVIISTTPQQSTYVTTSTVAPMSSQQQQQQHSLPSPPPKIVQSVISATPINSQAPIVAPKPQITQQISQTQPKQQQQQQQQQQYHHQTQIQQSPQSMSQHMPQTPTRPEIKITHMPVTSNSNDSAAYSGTHHYITSVSSGGGSGPVTVKTMTNSAMPTITTSAPQILTSSNVVYSEQQVTTIHTSVKNQNSNKLAQEQENEQFALAWLRATFEPVSVLASRIEQQDLYKMYLTACSKHGRTGVVPQCHFPRCVRNVFGGSVGPNQIKINQNSFSSFFYEGIKIRAQPHAVLHKGTILQAAVTTTTIKGSENAIKKEQQPTIIKTPINIQNQNKAMMSHQTNSNATSAPILQHVLSTNQTDHMHGVQQNRTTIRHCNSIGGGPANVATSHVSVSTSVSLPTIVTSTAAAGGTTSSSLIKAILANKVTTVDGTTTVIGTPNIVTTNIIPSSINPSNITATSNVNVHQVAQRQHLQKQREAQMAAAAAASATGINQSTMNVSHNMGKDSKAIPIVIKTPSGGTVTPNMKAAISGGNALIPATIIEKKAESMLEAYKQPNWDPVPPLAPLSGSIRQTSIIASIPVPTISPSKVDDDSNSTNLSANSSVYGTNPTTPSCQDESESAFAGFEGLSVPGSLKQIDDDGKDAGVAGNKHSHVVTANKMLTDLLERKSFDPPHFNVSAGGDISYKRKCDANANPTGDEPATKRSNFIIETVVDNSIHHSHHASHQHHHHYQQQQQQQQQQHHHYHDTNNTNKNRNANTTATAKSSSSAANLYAKLAASLLEDEDMELDDTPTLAPVQQQQQQQHQSIQQPQTVQVQQQLAPPPAPQSVIPASSLVDQQQQQQKPVITVPMQRQIIVSPNNARQQMIIAPPTSNQSQIGQATATATYKTESGYQTVPVILQHGGNSNQVGNTIQIQKQIGGIGQQIIQPVPQTQYMLATNQQGQTYLVAQQQPPPVNQILLTQTSQQQGGAPTKTIIILQQQQPTTVNTASAPQKVIMTTQQGQQMIVTQVPRQHHVIVNQHSGNASANVIQSNPQSYATNTIISQVTNTPISSSSQPQLMPQMRTVNSVCHTSASPNMQSNVITSGEKKKVFVTGSGNIEVTQVSQPIAHPPNVIPNITPNITSNVIQKPVIQSQSVNVPAQMTQQQQHHQQHQHHHHHQQQQPQMHPPPPPVSTQQQQYQNQQQYTAQTTMSSQMSTVTPKPMVHSQPIQQPAPPPPQQQQQPPPPIKTEPLLPAKTDDDIDLNWLYVCDWRGCQRRKFRSANEVYLHACAEHCPDNIDPNADIYCQWGPGPNLCDNLPRKRFSLMTHINDRHITTDSFKAAVQRRIANGPQTTVTQPVTIIKKPMPPNSTTTAAATSTTTTTTTTTTSSSSTSTSTSAVATDTTGTASPTLSTSSNSSIPAGSSAAMQAIKRHSMDLINPKELMFQDENEGPVTKSIRLTASLILRNLVNYTTTAKRCLRYYEPHLSGIALSNVESSRTIAQVLYEMNETRPY